MRREGIAGVSPVYGTSSCSNARRRLLLALYKPMRTGAGGVDPLHAEALARGGFRLAANFLPAQELGVAIEIGSARPCPGSPRPEAPPPKSRHSCSLDLLCWNPAALELLRPGSCRPAAPRSGEVSSSSARDLAAACNLQICHPRASPYGADELLRQRRKGRPRGELRRHRSR